jgi:hypothetical protein
MRHEQSIVCTFISSDSVEMVQCTLCKRIASGIVPMANEGQYSEPETWMRRGRIPRLHIALRLRLRVKLAQRL